MGSIGGTVARGLGDVMTFGTNELVGNPIGKMASGEFFKAPSATMPTVQNMSPMDMLTTTGGAPLLTDIALGADPDTAIASFLGLSSKEYSDMINAGSPALTQLRSQMVQIQGDTAMKTQAVQKLAQDFPNFMASKIPQYKDIADQATLGAAQKALDATAAKYAAGGNLSSGAAAEAMARTGADFASKNLDYGTNLALTDFSQQFNSANALLEFQRKMLGQGASEGFNAVQNAVTQNATNNRQNAGYDFQKNQADQQSRNAMYGALGGVAGAFGGPLLKSLFNSSAPSTSAPSDTGSGKSGFTSSPDLNLGGSGFGLNRYTPNA